MAQKILSGPARAKKKRTPRDRVRAEERAERKAYADGVRLARESLPGKVIKR